MLVSTTLPARQFKDRCRFEVASSIPSPVLGAGVFFTPKNKEAETLDTPRPHNPKGLPITMIPRPLPQEDIDVLRSATTRTKRPRYRRRTATRRVQPCRLNRTDAQTLLCAVCEISGFLALLCLAVSLATGGVSAVNDADVNGPDEMYHAQAGRYGYE